MNHAGRFAIYLKAIVFGVTDSLVSTVGLLAGLDVAGASHAILAFTGGIYAIVEAFSMAVGNFLSEESAEEYAARSDVADRAPILAGAVMFVAFVIAALIPLAPYLLLPDRQALAVSVILSILALFLLGLASAKVSKIPALARGMRMMLLGGAAILMGVLVGAFFPSIGG